MKYPIDDTLTQSQIEQRDKESEDPAGLCGPRPEGVEYQAQDFYEGSCDHWSNWRDEPAGYRKKEKVMKKICGYTENCYCKGNPVAKIFVPPVQKVGKISKADQVEQTFTKTRAMIRAISGTLSYFRRYIPKEDHLGHALIEEIREKTEELKQHMDNKRS